MLRELIYAASLQLLGAMLSQLYAASLKLHAAILS
jgi:hypothetical protein